MIMSTKEICKRGLSMTISLTLGNTGLPFADRLVGYHEPPGEFLLRQAERLAPLCNKRAGFLCIHLSHLPFLDSSIADLPPRRNRDAEEGRSTQRGAPFQIL